MGLDKYNVSLTLYKLEGPPSRVGYRPLREGGFRFEAGNVSVLCSCSKILVYKNSSLIRLLMPRVGENTTVYNNLVYTGFNRSSYLGLGLLSIVYPEKYLGFARAYTGSLINTTSGRDVTLFKHFRINTFVRLGDYYVVYRISFFEPVVHSILLNEFGPDCPALNDIPRDVEPGPLGIPQEIEYVVLNYTNTVPSDQAWLEVIWHNFNALAPFSYALVVAALMLLILRARKG
jgi:hypothetical protein